MSKIFEITQLSCVFISSVSISIKLQHHFGHFTESETEMTYVDRNSKVTDPSDWSEEATVGQSRMQTKKSFNVYGEAEASTAHS